MPYKYGMMKTLKFGRIRPETKPRLNFGNYLAKGFAAPQNPPSVDYSPAAFHSLSLVYKNDQLGDCVIAGGAHVRGVTSGNAGNEVIFTDDQIVSMYSNACGYNPRNPNSDMGCNEQQVLDYWTNVGFIDGVKLAGWCGVDASNPQECMTALYLFENLFFGMSMPDAWLDNMPQSDGFVWDVAGRPDYNNGHCVIGMGYDSKGVKISTWGMIGTITWAAVQKYAINWNGGELYVLLSPDMVNKAISKAPNGMNWTQLITDFNKLGGDVPVPPEPEPTPVPPPEPEPIPEPEPEPIPPVPVPPSPTPVPNDLIKDINAIFAEIIKKFPDKPMIQVSLYVLQYVIDIYIKSLDDMKKLNSLIEKK